MCLSRLLRSVFVLSCITGLTTTSLGAQESSHIGRPLWRAFDSRDTGAGESTYASALNDKGLVYAANEAGLLSYDGVSWRLLPHSPPSRGITHILALTQEPWLKGSWLTGGTNGLGLYAPDDRGHLNWSAIALPGSTETSEAEPRPTIHGLMPIGDLIYIVSDAGVYTLGSDAISYAYDQVLSGAPTGFAYPQNDGIVFEVDNGLLHLTKERYSALTLPPRWSELTPVSVLDSADLGQILVTQRSGVFTLKTSDSGITLLPLWDELPAPLDTSTVLAGAITLDGGFILGTQDGALLHFSQSGRLLTRLDKRAGFHAGPIRSITPGAAGNIFAFFDGGAVWFNSDDSLRVWDVSNGLEKPVTAVAVDSDRIYAGTTEGLYQSVSNGRMRLITELGDANILSLTLFKRSSMRGHTSLIVGTTRGLIDYTDTRVTSLFEDQPTAVFISRTQPSRLAAGFGTRAHLFDFDQGEWTQAGPIGPQFKSLVSDFTETADGDLLVVLNDGTLIAFAADEWLNSKNLERVRPLWTQESSRRVGFDSAPQFLATTDTIRLFMTGAALQWDNKNQRFQTDTSLATEFAKLPSPELSRPDFPRWYDAEQAAEALWLQTSTGSYVLPETSSPLVTLPAVTRGTASASAIGYDQRTDRLLFATPDGLASYPRHFLIAQQSKSFLPALHIRKVLIDDQALYYGDGPQPQITVPSTRDELLVEFSVLDWQTTCGGQRMIIETDAHPKISATVAADCTAAFAIENFEPQQVGLNLRLTVDGQAVTQDAHLNIKVSRPLIASPLLPLVLGVALGLWVLFNRLALQPPWPEPIQRYAALTSGLFILLATAQAINTALSPMSILSALALWLAVPLVAFLWPIFAESVLRLSDRFKAGKT